MAQQPHNSLQNRGLHRRSLIWIGLALLVFLVNAFVPLVVMEKWYYQGIFPLIRASYDLLLGWSPIPMIYFVFAFVCGRTFFWFKKWKNGFLHLASRAAGGIAWVIAFFYLLWGFNYRQIDLKVKLGLLTAEVTREEVNAEFYRATEALKNEVASLPFQFKSDQSISSHRVVDHDVREEVENALAVVGAGHKGRVRVRQLWPKGFLLRWSTAGIYIPHAIEGHIDGGLLSVQKPFTLAHEMAHGYGIADEGACNFIAWLTCSHSRDPWIRYGGALTYWRYAAAEMPDTAVMAVVKDIDPFVKRSLELLRENDKKYPDIMPQVRDALYSSYLKSHGVKGGLRSYNEVVSMVQQYLEKINAGLEYPSKPSIDQQ